MYLLLTPQFIQFLCFFVEYEQIVFCRANFAAIYNHDFTVKGLTEGKEYEFRVAAINNAGLGDYAETEDTIKAQQPPGKYCREITHTQRSHRLVGASFNQGQQYFLNKYVCTSQKQMLLG